MGVKGYKVFNPDWTCRGFQYEVGKTYKHDGKIEICGAGFHFCQKISDCFNYYSFDSNNKVAEVEAIGLVETRRDKSATNEIKIIRELTWHEVLDLVNTGTGNTGRYNSGHFNSGIGNTGDWNTYNWNSGNCNSGCYNSGNHNAGYSNKGNNNTGNCNSGIRNSGDWNSGDWNSGSGNGGSFNAGLWNTGNCNSGNYNSGSYNTGKWNSTNFSTGFFNSTEQPLYVFNKPTNMSRKDLDSLLAVKVMAQKFKNNCWISSADMTEEEKINHPEHETTGGYVRKVDYKTACGLMWKKMTDDEKAAVRDIPNFDPEIFKEITGIDINLKT